MRSTNAGASWRSKDPAIRARPSIESSAITGGATWDVAIATGAAGSIGRAVAHAAMATNPRCLSAYSFKESSVFGSGDPTQCRQPNFGRTASPGKILIAIAEFGHQNAP